MTTTNTAAASGATAAAASAATTRIQTMSYWTKIHFCLNIS